jgi:hypothetical protein
MAINYPSSLDTFTNPTSSDSLNSPSHSDQHANANDAIEALEAKLGIGASPAGSAVAGSVLVASSGGTSTWTTVGTAGINATGGSAGYVLTSANGTASTWSPSGVVVPVVSAGTAAYTLASGDQGKLLQFNGTFTVTVPTDATYDFENGTVINILNIGSGTITTAGAGGVTLNGNPGLKLNGQWSGATFVKRTDNTWVIVGDLSA